MSLVPSVQVPVAGVGPVPQQRRRGGGAALRLAVLAAWGATGLLVHEAPGGGLQVVASAQAQEALRPEVGKPMQAARDLIRAGRHKEALAKLREVDAIANRTPNENFLLEQMRGSAAAQAGDYDQAIKSFTAVMNSGRLSEADQGKYAGTLANLHYRARDYKNAIAFAERALKAAPGDGALRTVLIQSYFLAGDFGAASREALADIQAAEKAGQTPSEDKLQLLANVASRQASDRAAYAAALERLVSYYPKKEYWSNLLQQIQARPNFAGRLLLDLYRLRVATKTLDKPSDLVEMAQLALQDGQAAEAKKLIDDGFAAGVLGKGPEADRQKRLQNLANQKAASAATDLAAAEAEAGADKDGRALVSVGLAWSSMGRADKGIALIQRGIAKGGLKNPDDAHLHLGLAYLRAGNKPQAAAAFRKVTGTDGAADIARLWTKVP